MNSINNFLRLLRELQKIDPAFPLQYAVCLGIISQHEGLSISDLAYKTSLSLSTVSRIVGALSSTRQKGEPYGLVKVRISHYEKRRKEITLTPKGRLFIQSIDEVLSDKKTLESSKPRIASAV
jgi:DNA-binding MarR family transcriptional regulator